jgi:outer membrane protein OmpA-like peptidoglycan-associated protein
MNLSFFHKTLLSFVACAVLSIGVYAQDDEDAPASSGGGGCGEPDNKEAVKLYEKANDKKKYDFNERMGFLNEALALEPDWADANLLMANMHIKKADADEHPESYPAAKKYLKAAITSCPTIGAEPYYLLGQQLYMDEDFAGCITYLDSYIKFDTDDPNKLGKDYEFRSQNALEMLRWARFYESIEKNVHPFAPTPVPGISTAQDEYLAIITPDNTQALFIRRVPVSQMDRVWGTNETTEVFSNSQRQPSGEFEKGGSMPDPFNKNANEGGATMTIDNKHLFYTISKPSPEGGLNTDLYTSDLVDDSWTEIRSLGDRVNDPVWWDSQPSISADGKTLYFASNRPGGKGGIDIYKTEKMVNGEWGAPINLGDSINTQYDEKSPFIHSDSQTLYFSSNGHPGIGAYDIFYARGDAKANGGWRNPVNLGKPINTQGDDVGFFVSTDGETGFFCSNAQLPGYVGGYDVFQFELYKEARPEKVVIVTGVVKDPAGNPATGPATVELKNVRTKEKSLAVVDTSTGSYAAAIKVTNKDDYVLTVKKDGTAFTSQVIAGGQTFAPTKTELKPMEVKPVEQGSIYRINDINFTSNSAVLAPESMVVLEEFANYLKTNPKIKIAIHGHTDNVGDDSRNMDLSNERAFAVFEALTAKFGVPKSQITGAYGHGETNPIGDNNTEEGRAKNRRTEFEIISK